VAAVLKVIQRGEEHQRLPIHQRNQTFKVIKRADLLLLFLAFRLSCA